MEIDKHKNPKINSFFEKLKSHIIQKSSVIATQTLYFSLKGETTKTELVVKLYAPIQIDASTPVATKLSGAFVCYVDFSHLCHGHLIYGYDEFQAINFASSLDRFLKVLDNKCNLYSLDNNKFEFYFSDTCNHWSALSKT